ncbi:MAG: nitrous oxide reductase accessory protein NosL [Campylobacterota bacterium]
MKKTLLVLFALMLGMNVASAKGKMQMFQSVSMEKAQLMQEGESKLYCPNCGMHLPKFYKTNHAVRLDNGDVRQYCSIYCLVEEMELTVLRDKKDQIDSIMVVDVPSLKFIDATSAHYVVGSKKPGTMTTVSKYAFKNLQDAQAFAEKNDGTVQTYEQAYKTALEDFARDTAHVYKKRSSKMYKMGEKLYNKKCDKEAIEKIDVHSIGDFKAVIAKENVCGSDLNDGQLQGISLYWWDVRMKKFEELHGQNPEVQKYIKQQNR